MSDKRKPWRENVANEMIRQIEAGTAPWQKPWKPGVGSGIAHNPVSKRAYRGINAMWLDIHGYEDPRWMTYRQATGLGLQVRGGEKSNQVEYWKWSETKPVLDDAGKPVLGEDSKPQTQKFRLTRPRVFYANVFNGEQIDGLEPYKAPERDPSFDPNAEAEKLLEQGGVVIKHDQGDRAFYRPSTDEIHLPPRDAFGGPYEYYATALHELGHATGHTSRLDRDFGPRGTEAYAQEELRAEMTSYQVTRELGLGHYPERHAAYVESWLSAIKKDRNVLFQAARDAERMTEWIRAPDLRPALERQARENGLGKEKGKQQEAVMEKDNVQENQDQVQDETKATRYEIWGGGPGGFELVGFNSEDAPLNSETYATVEEAYAREEELKATTKKAQTQNSRVYLAVPFTEKDQAKAQGAKWDRKQKSWFVPKNTDPTLFQKWTQENQPAPEHKEHNPVAEFADEMKAAGVSMKGQPLMDGQWHRVSLDDDKNGQKNASYRAFLDGRPNGTIQNFRTGDLVSWVARGEPLSKEQRATLKVEAATRKAHRTAKRLAAQGTAAEVAQTRWDAATSAPELPGRQTMPTLYLMDKMVESYGLKHDDEGNTIVPVRDTKGALWSLQTIARDGSKRFIEGGRKQGLMHVIDPEKRMGQKGCPVFIAEGYSTAASVHAATAKPAIVAFDASNLKPVAVAVRKQYPDAEIIIAADNDHKLEHKPSGNVGLTKGTEAAEAVDGRMVAPVFDGGQKNQGLSDWNDLASDRGRAAVQEQIDRQLKPQKTREQPKAVALGR